MPLQFASPCLSSVAVVVAVVCRHRCRRRLSPSLSPSSVAIVVAVVCRHRCHRRLSPSLSPSSIAIVVAIVCRRRCRCRLSLSHCFLEIMLTLLSDNIIAQRDQEDILLGLGLETQTYLRLLDALRSFGKVRKQIEEDLGKLPSYTFMQFKKSTKKPLFEKNLRLAMGDTLGQDVLLSLLSERSNENRLNSFILACFSLSDNHFQDIKDHGLITGFHRLLERQPCHFSKPLMESLIHFILETCSADDNGKIIIESFHSTKIVTSPYATAEGRKRQRQESIMMEGRLQFLSKTDVPLRRSNQNVPTSNAANLEPWQTAFLLGDLPSTINGTGNRTATIPNTSSGSEHMPNDLSAFLPTDSIPTTPSLAGDVYELNTNDVVMAALSGLVAGQIHLTDPYYQKLPPFINMPITDSLKNQFIKCRHRIL